MGQPAAIQVAREMGLDWVAWRTLYSLCQKTGLLKRRFRPVHIGSMLSKQLGVPLDQLYVHLASEWRHRAGRFFLEPDVTRYAAFVHGPDEVVSRANALLRGRILCFSRWEADVGFPPDWLLNPVNGCRYPGDKHWSMIPDLSELYGDIKFVWESSRFGQVFVLVRAFALTGDDKYAEAFWTLVESWIDANPPEMGPNWKCGQEIAIRSFAWLFGLYAFSHHCASSDRRIGRLITYLWYNAVHIERNHWYALRCVRNNHSLSEAAGLYTVGVLLPFLPYADRWRVKGYRNLVSEALWQIYSDGSYVQHSMNYARLVVQLFTWCFRIAQVNGDRFPEAVCSRVRGLMRFLAGVQNNSSGCVPNYGSNDGALLFPLSSCDYLDYRPALNALSVVLDGRALYDSGPWSEESMWFSGRYCDVQTTHSVGDDQISSQVAAGETQLEGVSYPVGGYYVLAAGDFSMMMRCGRHLHRPAQADMLHVDVRYKGYDVLIDSGTYSYNPRGGWDSHFVSTAAHNTITVDGRSQMTRLGRFLWANWVHGHVLQHERLGSAEVIVGEHHGYSPLVHRRLLALSDEGILIIDRMCGDAKKHGFSLHWLIDDFPLSIAKCGAVIRLGSDTLQMRVGCSHPFNGTWARADETGQRGWQSLYYGERLPAWSFHADTEAEGPVWFATLIQPTPTSSAQPDALCWKDVAATLDEWGANPAEGVISAD